MPMPNGHPRASPGDACYRLVKLVRDDRITEPARQAVIDRQGPPERSKVTYLLHCPWCLSIYFGAALTLGRLRWPGGADAVARTSGGRRRLAMNCSGKHSAFLLSCVHNGWSIDDYLDPLHPLQRHIQSVVEEFTGAPIAHFGTDGCGAPLFGISLRALATGISRVAQGAEDATARLVSAVLQNPWAIDGPGRANTIVVEELGLFSKLGAEGVNVMAARDGTTCPVFAISPAWAFGTSPGVATRWGTYFRPSSSQAFASSAQYVSPSRVE